ncbi:MAG: preprotein translocase subunit SecE [Betaproteobacteria bacterium]|nr:preprotein translocase subunit SecE [Betaproteobacteria bacterium]
MVDIIKLAIGAALLVVGVAGYYWLGEGSLVLKVLAVLGGTAAGAAVAATSAQGQQFLAFAREAIDEVKKVVWPTRKETMQTTAAVFAFVVVMAVFLWVSDKSLEWVLYELVLGWKKT